jgi:hypothetical protein
MLLQAQKELEKESKINDTVNRQESAQLNTILYGMKKS